MAGEIIGFMIFGLFIVLVIVALKSKPKREMSAAERMSYESERGKLMAQKEFERHNDNGLRHFWN